MLASVLEKYKPKQAPASTVHHQFAPEGEFKALDEEVCQTLGKIRKYREEIANLWATMRGSMNLEKVHLAEETIKEKQEELAKLKDQNASLKDWFAWTNEELKKINRNGEYDEKLSWATN